MNATMNRLSILRVLIGLSASVVILAGCAAGRDAYKLGIQAEVVRDFEAAMTHYEQALAESPGDIEYRLKFEHARFAAAFEHFNNGRRAMDTGSLDAALAEFTKALELDPTHSLAQSELDRVQELMRGGTPGEPQIAPSFASRQEQARTDPSMEAQLRPTLTGPISLVMTQEAEVIFETIGELAGLNVIFDPDFRTTRISVDLDDLTVFEALDILALQTRTFWKPINPKTIIVAPENQQKRREYEKHILKTIYLTHSVNPTDITEAITAIRTLLNMRFIAQSTSMNAIILRDTPDKVAIAEKIIDDIDKGKAEVLVEATVLEVDRNQLRELGILPPQGTTVGFDSGAAAAAGDGGAAVGRNQVSIRDLDGINSGSFNLVIPDTVVRFLAGSSNTRLVQNPSIRATDGKLAQIRIGSRVPVASGSFQPAFVGATGTPVVQFQYIDVGVNLDITPRVLLNREVAMTVIVQVQATAGNSIIGGVSLPVFTNRSIQHEIRLREGETNILGGLITDTQTTAMSGIPGLSKIPILKHLFSTESNQRDQTEIIILLTPHILRMPDISASNLNGILVGTEVDTRLMGVPGRAPESTPKPEPPTLDPVPAGPESDGPAPEAIATSDAVSFEPAQLTLQPGVPTDIELRIDSASMTGADLVLTFDPGLVAVSGIMDGGFLSRDVTGVALLQNIDSERGTVIVSLERPERSAPISGDGSILKLRLEGLRSGVSVLRVTEFQVRADGSQTRTGKLAEVQITVP
jgi:general secretion pathway protein D